MTDNRPSEVPGAPAHDAPTVRTPRARQGRRLVLILVLVIVLGSAYGIYRVVTYDPDIVVEVNEANRLILNSGQGVVVIGIKVLPQISSPFARSAVDFTEERILNRHIRIDPGAEAKDTGGWILGYVYYEQDGTWRFLNEELVREGFALSSPRGRNIRHRKELDAAEAAARKHQRGLWHPDNAHWRAKLRIPH